MVKYILSVIFYMFLSYSAIGHEWYSANCCSDQDCFPVACEDILEKEDGSYLYNKIPFNKSMAFPSQDSKCHVCIGNYNLYLQKQGIAIPRCIYLQQSS